MNVLVVEDNASLATIIEMLLTGEGMTVQVASDGLSGVDAFDAPGAFDTVVTDMRLPGLTGDEVMAEIKKIDPDVPVIVITAFGSIEDAVGMVKQGAFDYITKPFDNDDFLHTVRRALKMRQLAGENKSLKAHLKNSITPDIVGTSVEMTRLKELVGQVAETGAPVLVTGESGTGKELVARLVHALSPRASRQFVVVNCAAIPEHLVESELFGFKKGSFTGADADRKGRILEAEKGTLFLDEIGELPLSVQAKLLRFLQEGEVQQIGSPAPAKADVRVVAATNRDLKKQVDAGEFREDLYYRLAVFPVETPPLRKRTEDIPALASAFAAKYGRKDLTFSADALKSLREYPWPGNVRELENMVYRLTIVHGEGDVAAAELPIEVANDPMVCLNLTLPEGGMSLEELEKQVINAVLMRFEGNKAASARYLGIPRHVLLYRMEKFGIESPEKKK